MSMAVQCICRTSMVLLLWVWQYNESREHPWFYDNEYGSTMNLENIHGSTAMSMAVQCIYRTSMVLRLWVWQYNLSIEHPWFYGYDYGSTMYLYIYNIHGSTLGANLYFIAKTYRHWRRECMVIIRIAWRWTIMEAVFDECQFPFKLKTSIRRYRKWERAL